MNFAVVRDASKESSGGRVQCRMTEFWGNLGEWDKNKAAVMQAWMRNFEFVSGDGFRSVKKNVQIYDPRAFGNFLFAAHKRFDGLQRVEKYDRIKACLCFEDAIVKPGLLEVIDGFGLVNRRHCLHVNARWTERVDRGAKICQAVADI